MRFYIETYGCQMNSNDSEIVASLLESSGFQWVDDSNSADIVLINTCAIRDNAEQRILGRIAQYKKLKRTTRKKLVIGVLGCMAARVKEDLLSPKIGASVVVGPDGYRYLPELLRDAAMGTQGVYTRLSRSETYGEIEPFRYGGNRVSAFTSIMRGCNYACTYCVVPFTRGPERSRSVVSILQEVKKLAEQGYKEVTLLGQTVDSYAWKEPSGKVVPFSALLEQVAIAVPDLRVRFATSHPHDMTEDVLRVMATYPNVCHHIHLPVQSGATSMLQRMKRRYTREEYLNQIALIRKLLPDCSITTDIIAGFTGETQEEHEATLSLMREVHFDLAYMFKYSERPGTYAQRRLGDTVSEELKGERLQEIIDLQQQHSYESNLRDVGKTFEVLVEGFSHKSDTDLCGRNMQNRMIVFPAADVAVGSRLMVRVEQCTPSTLLGRVVAE